MNIRAAVPSDSAGILKVTREAFTLYHDELHADYVVGGLVETEEDILSDIMNHHVYVAESDGEIVGSIRFTELTPDLAYIYRFGVSPAINNTGIGSHLLSTVIDECRKSNFKAIALHQPIKGISALCSCLSLPATPITTSLPPFPNKTFTIKSLLGGKNILI